ncbi:MAG: nitrite/sulfite reductase, partial [Actinomycetota bacterium]
TMACTGIEFCKLAIVETKQRADWLYRELEERLPGFDEPSRINVNGCPNSCARFQIADIGLMGSLYTKGDGTRSDAFQVHLGGHLGEDHRFGRKVKGLKVPGHQLADYVERLLRRYLATRTPGERFGEWSARAEEAWLKF